MALINLSTVSARDKLPVRDEPFYTTLMKGCALGYRKMTAGKSGTWVARYSQSGSYKPIKKSFGSLDHLPPSDRFAAAKVAADEWFKHLGAGGSTEVVTVKKACESYAQHIRDSKGDQQADDLEGRYERWVYADKALAQVELQKLTRKALESWRKRVAETPVVVNPHSDEKRTRPRSLSTLNRDMTALRAALNHALDHGHVTTDMSWRVALRPAEGEGANGRRTLYLARDQRREMLKHADAEVAGFLKGMMLLPLRPGALASLKVGHFNKQLGVLTVGKDKSKMDRHLALPKHLVEFFSEVAKDKLAVAPLIDRANGKPWARDAWKKPVKAAAVAAGLPRETTAYTLRHCVITDLVSAGTPLLTVAQMSGTSVAMIEKHYGHLQADRAVAALEQLAL